MSGYSIIANNIISDCGFGQANWVWTDHERHPIRILNGKLDNPLVMDVVVQGNVIYDTGHDQVMVDGQPRVEPTRYQYSVFLETKKGGRKAFISPAISFIPERTASPMWNSNRDMKALLTLSNFYL